MQPFSPENTGLALDAFAHFEHLAVFELRDLVVVVELGGLRGQQ